MLCKFPGRDAVPCGDPSFDRTEKGVGKKVYVKTHMLVAAENIFHVRREDQTDDIMKIVRERVLAAHLKSFAIKIPVIIKVAAEVF